MNNHSIWSFERLSLNEHWSFSNSYFVFSSSPASRRSNQSMFGRWISRGPKIEKYSLENLRRLGDLLERYAVDYSDDDGVVDTIKEITQILIWGDQHKPAILEYFFEQNMHYVFLQILEMTKSPNVIKQLLQTINILFENIHEMTSLYFLLSNNYVNRVICHEFDFSNDEILAYYVYFLRTLSFKLNKNTLYFFFNEHLGDFPLYSEAIKFFNSEESMIRVAVRTVTLNIFAVNDLHTQEFILDKKVTPYFSNLVHFISNHALTLHELSRSLHSPGQYSKINHYLAEHCDTFYYINDIINLDVEKINDALTHHLMELLVKPIYADSLIEENPETSSSQNTRICTVVALALLCHVLHIFRHPPLVTSTVAMLFSDDSQGLNYSQSPRLDPTNVTKPLPEFAQARNPYREAIFNFLTPDEESDDLEFCDLNTLPAICLLYMSCRNHAVAPDVLVDTAVYPQKLLKSRKLLETLTSSSEDLPNDTAFSPTGGRRRSIDSLSVISTATTASQDKPHFFGTGEQAKQCTDPLSSNTRAINALFVNDSDVSGQQEPPINTDVPEIRIHFDKSRNEVENRRHELVSKLVSILCEHYNRCRPITIQMAAELLLELLHFNGLDECLSPEQTELMLDAENFLQEDLELCLKEYTDFPLDLIEAAVEDSKFNGDKYAGTVIMEAISLFPPLPPVPPPPISITPSKTPPVAQMPYPDDEDLVKNVKALYLIRECLKLLSRRTNPEGTEDVQPSDNNNDDELMFQDDETQQAQLEELANQAESSTDSENEMRMKSVLDKLGIQLNIYL